MKFPRIPAPAKQTKRSFFAKALCIALLVVSVFLDQLTKKIVVDNMALHQDIPLWEGVFHWTYIRNRGAAFGMLQGHREVFLVLSTVAIAVLILYLIWSNCERLWWMTGIGMIAGGGIGNMIDRVRLEYVVDFINVELIDFAIFNVADCFVCVGVGILMILLIRDIINEYREEKKKNVDGGDSNE